MSEGDKREKAKIIQAEVDALFHTAEKTNPDHNVTYLDIVRIADRVREHFNNKTPPQIEYALEVATGLCHPEKLAGIQQIKKGLGGLLACAGGTSLLWGIIQIIVYGLAVTTTTGILWWKSTAVSILLGGPIGIAIGIASLAAGVYVLSLKAPSKRKSVVSLDVIKKGIDNWVAADAISSLPDVKWVQNLSEEEFFALISLAWHMADADGAHSQEEMLIIDLILKTRKPTEQAVAEGLGSTPVNQAVVTLRQSKYADKCFDLIKFISESDGTVSPEEAAIVGLFEAN
jgi:hypothetical protein